MKHGVKNAHSRLFRNNAERRRSVLAANDTAEIHSATPLSGLPTARAHPQAQSGALAYRPSGKIGIEILLVRKMRSGAWGIPKGKLTVGLSSAENAAKEAFEEAGIKGDIDEAAATSYRAVKRKLGERLLIEVAVHVMKVTETLDDYPEKDRRDARWCTCEEASLLLHEPALIQLCRSLSRGDG